MVFVAFVVVLRVVVLLAVVLALALLVLPDRRAGERFLVRWGIERPTAEQAGTASRYLRQRRVLYPVCWFAGPLLAYAVTGLPQSGGGAGRQSWWGLLASILAALLLAELVAALRPAGGTTRLAVLSRRRWVDLVPRWSVVAHLLLVGVAAAQAVAALAAHGWVAATLAARAPGAEALTAETRRHLLDISASWLVLVEAAFGLLGVYGVVLLALRRRAQADHAVDRVLRTRSARVAVGVGIGLALGLINQTNARAVELHALALTGGGSPTAPGWVDIAARLDGIGMVIVLVGGLAAWRIVAAPLGPPATVPA